LTTSDLSCEHLYRASKQPSLTTLYLSYIYRVNIYTGLVTTIVDHIILIGEHLYRASNNHLIPHHTYRANIYTGLVNNHLIPHHTYRVNIYTGLVTTILTTSDLSCEHLYRASNNHLWPHQTYRVNIYTGLVTIIFDHIRLIVWTFIQG
jgi:hypothetical protein